MQGNCWGAGGTTCPVYGISLALGVGLGIWVPTRKAGRGLFSLSVQSSRQRFLDDSKRDPADGLPPVKLIVHWVKVTCPDEAEASKQTCKEEKLLYIPKQTINRGPCSSQKGEMNNSRFFNLLFFFFPYDLCLVIQTRWKKMEISKEASLDENISANSLPLAKLELNYNCKMCIFVVHSSPPWK